MRKLYALIARVHPMTGNSQQALWTCAAGLKLDPQDAELWHRKGVIHRHRGESSEAERSWRRILELKRPEKYCSFDDGLYGHITWRNLAHLAAERGDHAEAIRLWEAVLAECRGDREALAKLGARPPTWHRFGPRRPAKSSMAGGTFGNSGAIVFCDLGRGMELSEHFEPRKKRKRKRKSSAQRGPLQPRDAANPGDIHHRGTEGNRSLNISGLTQFRACDLSDR